MTVFARNSANQLPSEYVCPLTMQPFQNPVLSRHGINYERSAILEWLDQGNKSCPLTKKPLTVSGLIHNTALKRKVQSWKSKNGYKEREQSYGRFTRAGLLVHNDVEIILPKEVPKTVTTYTTEHRSKTLREKLGVFGGKKNRRGKEV